LKGKRQEATERERRDEGGEEKGDREGKRQIRR